MADKRFTDVHKWDEDWFVNLPYKYKLFWLHILDKCTDIGIWNINLKVTEAYIENKLDMKEIEKLFKDKFIDISNSDGKRFFIKDFCYFQYGDIPQIEKNGEEKAKRENKPYKGLNNALKSYRIKLKKENLWDEYLKTLPRLKEDLSKASGSLKEKEKEQNKVKGKEKNKGKDSCPCESYQDIQNNDNYLKIVCEIYKKNKIAKNNKFCHKELNIILDLAKKEGLNINKNDFKISIREIAEKRAKKIKNE